MKIPLSITLSLLLVPVAGWLASGTVRKEGPPDSSPQPPSRGVHASRDSGGGLIPAAVEVRLPDVAAVGIPAGVPAAGFPVPSSSPQPNSSGVPEKLPRDKGRRASLARVEGSFPLASSLPDSNHLPGAAGSPDPAVATPARNVIPKAEADPSQSVPQPAAWVDLGDISTLTPSEQEEVQAAAVDLHEQIAASGLDPASPEYRDLWEKAVADSDRMFRQRFGGRAWMAHHIQAFHLGQVTATP